MLQFRLTKKVQTEMGIKTAELAEIKKPDTFLGNWYVNLFYLDRRKTLIFMNERTLLSFVMFGTKKKNVKRLPEIFSRGLEQCLIFGGCSVDKIFRAFSEYDDYEYTKTDSRVALGNLNDLVSLYKHMIAYEGGLKSCNLTDIIRKANRTPQRNLGWSYSIETFKELLEAGRVSS